MPFVTATLKDHPELKQHPKETSEALMANLHSLSVPGPGGKKVLLKYEFPNQNSGENAWSLEALMHSGTGSCGNWMLLMETALHEAGYPSTTTKRSCSLNLGDDNAVSPPGAPPKWTMWAECFRVNATPTNGSKKLFMFSDHAFVQIKTNDVPPKTIICDASFGNVQVTTWDQYMYGVIQDYGVEQSPRKHSAWAKLGGANAERDDLDYKTIHEGGEWHVRFVELHPGGSSLGATSTNALK